MTNQANVSEINSFVKQPHTPEMNYSPVENTNVKNMSEIIT